jgi:iduronate 2-sulfatase
MFQHSHHRIFFLVPVLCLLFLTAKFTPTQAAERPNVLFIAVDDLRPELFCYGVEKMVTPNLDRLAKCGVKFDRAYCNIAVCGASRASLLKGLRPTPTRFTTWYTWADEDAPKVPSLPMTFKQNGYYTASVGKVYHHNADDAEAWSQPAWRPKWRERGPAYEEPDEPDEAYPDHQTCDRAIANLRRLVQQDKPFFLGCGFYRPHLPFVAPKKYWDLYPTEKVTLPDNYSFFPHELPHAFDYTWGELRAYHGIPKQGPVDDDTARQLIRGYHACVSFMDFQVGRLLNELEQLNLVDNTIIVFWSDHGWQLGEHGFWCKHTNFEVASRAPLLIVAPGVEGGRVCSRLVEYVDIYPTLCDMAGLPKPDHLHGKSMNPLLADINADHKNAVITRYNGGDAVRTDNYRYMEMRARNGLGELQGVGLFDLKKDPNENQNVAEDPAYAEVREQLKAKLDAARSDF